ncbi:MAG: Rab family GTPase [Methanobacteriota archaeon]
MPAIASRAPAVRKSKHVKKKICLVGDASVGKSSLIRRFVLNLYDDYYLTTLGTKVSKKELKVPFASADLIVRLDLGIWDIMGQKSLRELLQDAYFAGTNGVLAVCDVTRRVTLDGLDEWIERVRRVAGRVPIVACVNKKDLSDRAEFGPAEIEAFATRIGCPYFLTSAKSGENVEAAFQRLGGLIVDEHEATILASE